MEVIRGRGLFKALVCGPPIHHANAIIHVFKPASFNTFDLCGRHELELTRYAGRDGWITFGRVS